MPPDPQPSPSAARTRQTRGDGLFTAKSAAVERLAWAVRRAGGNKIVAQRSGVPLGTLNNYVRGRNGMKTSTLEALALACEVSLAWILSGEQPPAAGGGDMPAFSGLSDAAPAPAPAPDDAPATPARRPVPMPAQQGLDVAMLAQAIEIVRGLTGDAALIDPADELARRLAAVYAVLTRSAAPTGSGPSGG